MRSPLLVLQIFLNVTDGIGQRIAQVRNERGAAKLCMRDDVWEFVAKGPFDQVRKLGQSGSRPVVDVFALGTLAVSKVRVEGVAGGDVRKVVHFKRSFVGSLVGVLLPASRADHIGVGAPSKPVNIIFLENVKK